MTYTAEVLADSPLAYWQLDEPAGLVMLDSSGNTRHGVIDAGVTLGAATVVPNDPGPAWSLNAFEGGQVAVASWMGPATALSAEVWAHLTAYDSDGTILFARANVGAGNSAANKPWALIVLSTGAIVCRVYNNAGATVLLTSAAGVFTLNADHHVVLTQDGTNARIFCDGVQVATAALTGVPVSTATSTQPMTVGRTQGTSPSIYTFTGRIGHAAFYGTGLSAVRVFAHYNAGVQDFILGGTGQEAEQGQTGTVTVGINVAGGTGTEAEQGGAGVISFNVPGGTAQESEHGNPGTTASGIDIMGGTAEEAEQAHTGTVVEGTVIPGGVAQEVEQALAGVTFVSPGSANNYDLQRVRTGRGVPLWEPDVVPAPLPTSVHVNDIVAAKWDGYGITNTQIDLTNRREVRKPAYRYRILVAGRDLTYWRGHVTPAPQMQLVEPLLYGPASLELPQVQVPFEQPGYGTLGWMKPGAPVRIILVDVNNDLVITVWKGRLLAPKISGARLSWSMMGEATGPAALQDKQIPLNKRRNDLGFWWWGAINQLRLPFLPRLGPDTGIKLWNSGGASYLNYMLDLSAKGWTRSGNQWTCMPDVHETGGNYRVARKDRTTIHATAYLDDHMIVADLTRDPAEEPNRMFPNSVSPGGRRIRFGVYPAMSEGPAPMFPGHMEPGDTGDGVLALISRLVIVDYLDLEDKPGGYDDDVEDAVRALQRKAGLAVTGEVNNATWDALFDTGITGYDTAGSRILPAEEWDSVRRYDRTPNGNIIRQNPTWDPDQLVVDRTVSMGPDFTRQQDLSWARRNITDENNPDNWVGSLTFNGGGVIIGEHNFGDPLTEADIQSAHVLRPGMNIWLPTWAGGTLVHISALRLDGGPVVADVDTRARDSLQVWEVQARNRESRENPARAFLLNHRSSMMPKDAIIEFDENGGTIERSRTWMHEGWNHFPVVAGQEGTIAWLKLHTGAEDSDPAEFVCAVTAKEVTDEKWQALIGDPLTEAGTKRWTNENVRAQLDDRYVLLYAAGNDQNPCGYFPGKKVDDTTGEPTDDPLTGRWEDPASFAFRTQGVGTQEPVLWVSVYVKHPTRLRDGRVFKNQGESGS